MRVNKFNSIKLDILFNERKRDGGSQNQRERESQSQNREHGEMSREAERDRDGWSANKDKSS